MLAIAVTATLIAAMLWQAGPPFLTETITNERARDAPVDLPLPELGGELLDGGPFTSAVIAGSRLVLVNFWTSRCAPCRSEQPVLSTIAERHARQGLVAVGIGHKEQRDAALAFTQEFRAPYPSIFDPSAALAGRFGVVGLPATFLARDGRLVHRFDGAVDEARLEAAVARQLALAPEAERGLTSTIDAARVVYSDQTELWIASARGEAARRLTNDGALMPYLSGRWSPDGRFVAAERSGLNDAGTRLALVRVADGVSRMVSGPGKFLDGYDWSPDGRWLVYSLIQEGGTFAGGALVGGQGEIRLYDIAQEVDRRIGDGVHPAFTSQGREIGYAHNAGGIAITSLDGASTRLLYRERDLSAFALQQAPKGIGLLGGPLWSPDGSAVAFAALERGPVDEAQQVIFVLPTSGQAPRVYPIGKTGALHHVAALRWSPTSQQLAYALVYAEPHHHVIGVIDAGSATTRPLYDSSPHFLDFSWSPDGRMLLLGLDSEATWLLLRPDRGGVIGRFGSGWRPDWCACR